MKSTSTHATFNRWLIFAGLLVFGAYLAYQQQLLGILMSTDRSGLSLVILAFFSLASLHVGLLAYRLGRETAVTLALTDKALCPGSLIAVDSQQRILVDGNVAKTSYAHEHLAFLAEKNRAHGFISGQDLLLDRLDNQIRRGHETGWFVADLMIRLGLLGTVIGFILMLGSISTVTSLDLPALQQLLGNMSEGMRVALYTTLCGLSAGILLSFQYQLLDQGADRLLADIIELSEVHAIDHLRKFADARPPRG